MAANRRRIPTFKPLERRVSHFQITHERNRASRRAPLSAHFVRAAGDSISARALTDEDWPPEPPVPDAIEEAIRGRALLFPPRSQDGEEQIPPDPAGAAEELRNASEKFRREAQRRSWRTDVNLAIALRARNQPGDLEEAIRMADQMVAEGAEAGDSLPVNLRISLPQNAAYYHWYRYSQDPAAQSAPADLTMTDSLLTDARRLTEEYGAGRRIGLWVMGALARLQLGDREAALALWHALPALIENAADPVGEQKALQGMLNQHPELMALQNETVYP